MKQIGRVLKETDKSILFIMIMSKENNTYNISKWIPKSRLHNVIRFEHYVEINMPMWIFLKYKKELNKKHIATISQLKLSFVEFHPDI